MTPADDNVHTMSCDSKYIDMKNVSHSNSCVAAVELRDGYQLMQPINKNSLNGDILHQQRMLGVRVPPVDDDVEIPGNTATASEDSVIPCHSKPQGRTGCDAKYKNMENVSPTNGHVANVETGFSYPLRRPIKRDSLNGDILIEQRMLDVCVPPADDDVYTMSYDSKYIDMKNVSRSNRRVVVVEPRYSFHLKAPVKKDSQYDDIILQQILLDVCVPPADDGAYRASCDSKYTDLKNVSLSNDYLVLVEPRYSCPLKPSIMKVSQYDDIILQQRMLDMCVPPADDDVEIPGNTATTSEDSVIPWHSKPQGRTNCDTKDPKREHASSNNSRS